jgi:hypothetical protein
VILGVPISSYLMFPDTSLVGEIIGAGFLVVDAVQIRIRKRTLDLNDIEKTIDSTLKELNSTQSYLRSLTSRVYFGC